VILTPLKTVGVPDGGWQKRLSEVWSGVEGLNRERQVARLRLRFASWENRRFLLAKVGLWRSWTYKQGARRQIGHSA
jgi:hypothetical protein